MHPKEISPDEILGRRISQSGNARPSGKRRILMDGHPHISVDRLSIVSSDEAIKIAQAEAEEKGVKFHGWLKMRACDAMEDERQVVYDPTDSNPIHAHIVLPDSADKKDHVHALADYENTQLCIPNI